METNQGQPDNDRKVTLVDFWNADQAVRAIEQEMADLSVILRKKRKELQKVVKELEKNGIEAPDSGPGVGIPMTFPFFEER